MSKIYNVIMLGITGAGKSQLCNFLLDDPTNSKYKVGEDISSQTQMEHVIKQDEENWILENKYHFIDSCGGDDSDGNDLKNLEEYTKFLQKKGEVNCIIYVFNYETKVSDSIKEYLKKLSLIFTPIEFYDHLIIILTHYPQNAKSKDINKMKKCKKQINVFMKEAFKIENNDEKDIFFIDTDPDEDKNLNKFYNEKQKENRKAIIDKIGDICKNFPHIHISQFMSNVNAINKRNNIGHYYYYKIRGSNEGSVWGDVIYTDDSNIAKAAVLEGKCSLGEEIIVRIKMVEGLSFYPCRNKNGIKSLSWGSWPASYIFAV